MRFILLKNGEAIPEWQAALIAALSRKQPKTARAYDMKEDLRGILESGHPRKFAAEVSLRTWISRARRSSIAEFETLGDAIEEHLGGLLAIFGGGGMSNGPNEALDGLVQAAKARARGFRALENLIAVAFPVAGSLSHLPGSPWRTIDCEGPIMAQALLFRFLEAPRRSDARMRRTVDHPVFDAQASPSASFGA